MLHTMTGHAKRSRSSHFMITLSKTRSSNSTPNPGPSGTFTQPSFMCISCFKIFTFKRESSVNSLAKGCAFIEDAKCNFATNENPGSISVPTIQGRPKDSETASIFLARAKPHDLAIFILIISAAPYSAFLITS